VHGGRVSGLDMGVQSGRDGDIGLGRYGSWRPGTPVWVRLLTSFGTISTVLAGLRVVFDGATAVRVLFLVAGLVALTASVVAVVVLRRDRADRT
jgi:hypothetical protein